MTYRGPNNRQAFLNGRVAAIVIAAFALSMRSRLWWRLVTTFQSGKLNLLSAVAMLAEHHRTEGKPQHLGRQH
jgi:hypothetical protein